MLLLITGIHASTSYSPAMLLFYSLPQSELKNELSGSLPLLWRAAMSGSKQAEEQLMARAKQTSQIYWINKVASLGNLTAIKFLAQESADENLRKKWLLKAARQDDTSSLFELALMSKNQGQRLEYLHLAAELKYVPAIIALAKIYYENRSIDEATLWLRKASAYDAQSQHRLGRLLWQQGKQPEALQAFEMASESYSDSLDYSETIKEIKQVKLEALIGLQTERLAPLNVRSKMCKQRLQFVATSLDSAVHARQFKRFFQQDERLTNLPICILPIVWIQDNALECITESARQRCDLWPLAKNKHVPAYSHMVLFLPSGKAYVQNGLMHLDQSDVYSVFVHELAHFAGFVDEYAVSGNLAEQYCNSAHDAPNLLVLKQDGLETQDTDANVQVLATHKWGEDSMIAKSRTCASLAISTYKPSSDITFLEHHDTDHIPPLYLYLWREQLEQQQITISEYFARLATEKNDQELSQYWRNLAL